MNDILEIRKLIDELNNASILYYNGQESPLEDREFDQKLKILQFLEKKNNLVYADSPTINVGAPVIDEIKKVTIQGKPMLSLDKVHTEEEIIDFSDGYDLAATIKCDGLSVRLIYENGKLFSANTRGNGEEGSDITEHIKYFLNVPLTIDKKERFIIDGEAIIYINDFEIINKNGEFKNPRNTASGSLALLDMSIVKNRKLSFIGWDIIEGGNDKSKQCYHYKLEEMEELGFTPVPGFVLDCTKVEKQEIINLIGSLQEIADLEGIPTDGIVWKINDIAAGDAKGRTAHHWSNAVAWKPEIKEYETELIDIEWSMGRTGTLCPVAIIEPVDIDGTTIERCSLHNLSIMQDVLGTYPEMKQKVWVYKANEIIPQISRAVKNNQPHDHILDNGMIHFCPMCGEPTEIVESDSGVLNVVCGNQACSGKLLNRVEHYLGIKGLNVKGISKMTIGKLIDWGWVDGLRDIYKLDRYRAEWVAKAGFGEASVGKILNNISASTREVDLSAFISALGIPLIGRNVAKQIVKICGNWETFRSMVGSDWSIYEGFGPEISGSINNFDYTEADEIAEILAFKQPEVQSETPEPVTAIKDKKFCVTGKVIQFKNRDELKADIEVHGGKLVGSVTSATDYLITNTPDSGTAKNKRAQELGVKIITEEEYIKMKG